MVIQMILVRIKSLNTREVKQRRVNVKVGNRRNIQERFAKIEISVVIHPRI